MTVLYYEIMAGLQLTLENTYRSAVSGVAIGGRTAPGGTSRGGFFFLWSYCLLSFSASFNKRVIFIDVLHIIIYFLSTQMSSNAPSILNCRKKNREKLVLSTLTRFVYNGRFI